MSFILCLPCCNNESCLSIYLWDLRTITSELLCCKTGGMILGILFCLVIKFKYGCTVGLSTCDFVLLNAYDFFEISKCLRWTIRMQVLTEIH